MSTESSTPRSACPPPFILEQLMNGEATEPWRAHVESCERCAKRLRDAKEVGEGYLASPEAQALRARLRAATAQTTLDGKAAADRSLRSVTDAPPVARPQRSSEPPDAPTSSAAVGAPPRPSGRSRWSRRVAAAAVPLAAAVALIILRPSATDPLHAKGAAALHATVEVHGHLEPWQGEPLSPGAQLQLSWSAPRALYLVVVAQDRRGELTVLFPERSDVSAHVNAGRDVPLGGSVRVDSSSDGARIWALWSERPFPVADAVRAVEHHPDAPGEALGVRASRLDLEVR